MSTKAGTRKCAHCNEEINVRNKDKLDNVLRYKGKFYHKDCFTQLAESRVAKNNRYSASWQEALDNISLFIEDAKQSIGRKIKTDPLNDYLLLNYEVATLGPLFWSTVADIGNGIYRNKRCKAISCDVLLDMWKWYQKDLNNTYVWNKTHGKDMAGEMRVKYDLAILMNKYGEYMKFKAKKEKARINQQIKKEEHKIDYNKIKSTSKTDGLGDISDLLDELI